MEEYIKELKIICEIVIRRVKETIYHLYKGLTQIAHSIYNKFFKYKRKMPPKAPFYNESYYNSKVKKHKIHIEEILYKRKRKQLWFYKIKRC